MTQFMAPVIVIIFTIRILVFHYRPLFPEHNHLSCGLQAWCLPTQSPHSASAWLVCL